MAARDCDRPPRCDDRGQRFGTAQHGDAARPRCADLGVRIGNRRRDDDGIQGVRKMGGVVTDVHRHAGGPQAIERRRVAQVGTGDAVTHPREHQ